MSDPLTILESQPWYIGDEDDHWEDLDWLSQNEPDIWADTDFEADYLPQPPNLLPEKRG